MTYLEAALRVLASAGQPLTTREITDKAVYDGLVVTQGKTPHASMSAALYKASNTAAGIVKVADQGKVRARRGSVRWALPIR